MTGGMAMTQESCSAASCLPHPLASCALANGDKIVLRYQEHYFSAKALRQQVSLWAACIAEALPSAEKYTIAISGAYNADYIIALHAVGWLGACALPLPPAPPFEEQAQWWLKHLGALLQKPQVVLWIDLQAPAPWKQTLVTFCPAGVLFLEDLQKSEANGQALAERFWPLEELRLQVCTSGSSQEPQLVDVSTQQLLLAAFGSVIRLGHCIDDVWFLCLPLQHIAALAIVYRAAWSGAQVWLQEHFDASMLLEAMQKQQISLLSLVPTMLVDVLALMSNPLPEGRLRAILLGGAAASEAVLEKALAYHLPIYVCYGATETAAMVTVDRFDSAMLQTMRQQQAGAIGSVLPFARLKVGQDMALTISGPQVSPRFAGCWQSQDAGHVLAERWYIEGRLDDVIISGGKKISAQKIIHVLEEHEAVAEAYVMAYSHARWGQRPIAWVVCCGKSKNTLNESILRHFCRQHLPSYGVPDRFIIEEEPLPRTALGKLQRQVIAQNIKARLRFLELST